MLGGARKVSKSQDLLCSGVLHDRREHTGGGACRIKAALGSEGYSAWVWGVCENKAAVPWGAGVRRMAQKVSVP